MEGPPHGRRGPAMNVNHTDPGPMYISAKARLEKLKEKMKNLPKESEFVKSRAVRGLERTNFKKYIDDKQAAMVFFYDPDCHLCHQYKPHFMKTAKTLTDRHGTRGFATVDCTQEPSLCEAEGVNDLPTFKLYVGGKFVNNLNSYNGRPVAPDMINFFENAPPCEDIPKPWPSQKQGRGNRPSWIGYRPAKKERDEDMDY